MLLRTILCATAMPVPRSFCSILSGEAQSLFLFHGRTTFLDRAGCKDREWRGVCGVWWRALKFKSQPSTLPHNIGGICALNPRTLEILEMSRPDYHGSTCWQTVPSHPCVLPTQLLATRGRFQLFFLCTRGLVATGRAGRHN